MLRKSLRTANKRRRKGYNHKSPWRRKKCDRLKHGGKK
jgi:hypothetical protein